tara:strand:- start:306 stop:1769 length:1464 start_codon:yes stop_codon:yes gene_type:complete
MGLVLCELRVMAKIPRYVLFCCLLVISNPVLGNSILDLFMSPADEQRIGAQEHPKILKAFGGAYEDPKLTPYIKSIGQFLVRTSETPGADFTFTILNTPLVNAFALPGGYVYVTRGLLALASNEAEVAGVLAHEIGHVTARHSASRATNTGLAQLGLIILDVLSGSSMASQIGEVGALAVIQSYSRDDEFEADSLGVKYLSRAGFDPNAMSTFLEKLGAHSSFESARLGVAQQKGIDFFASHPRTPERVRRAIQLAGTRHVDKPMVARELYLRKIDGMLYGDAPDQGMHKDGLFIHPVLGFQFNVPKSFIILNQSDMVIGRSSYGGMFQFDADQNQGHKLEQYIRYKWADGAALSEVSNGTIGGLRSSWGRLSSRSSDGSRVWLIAIEFDNRLIYRFVVAIPDRLSDSEKAVMKSIPFSFRRLAADAASGIRPLRVRTFRTTRGDDLDDLVRLMRIADYPLERFLIMNGLTQGSAIPADTLVKVIGD